MTKNHKLTPLKKKNIITFIRAGCSLETAALCAGCSAQIIRREMAENNDFATQISKAEEDSEVLFINKIRQAANKEQCGRAAAWDHECHTDIGNISAQKYAVVLAECEQCQGTGLYQGCCERDGCAVECDACNGRGMKRIQFTPFMGRKPKVGVTRVFKNNCAFVHSANDTVKQSGEFIEFSKGGCTYDEWLNGVEPKPVEELYCPYLWTNHGLQGHDVHDLYHCLCRRKLSIGGVITDCSMWPTKATCWAIFNGKLDANKVISGD